jgi:PAS domain S-box-containing protein
MTILATTTLLTDCGAPNHCQQFYPQLPDLRRSGQELYSDPTTRPPPYQKSPEQILKPRTNDNSRFSGLARQGIVLVGAFLIGELGFIGSLGWLLTQAEAEGARFEKAREVTAKADRLMLVVYDTGDSVGRYTRSLQLANCDGKADAVSSDEVPGIIAYLRQALKNKADALALLDKIEKNITPCLPVIHDIKLHSSELAEPGARQAWDEKRLSIQPMVNQLILDIPSLVAVARQLENDIPEEEHLTRKLTEKVLYIGLFLNILAVLLVAYLFTSRIIKKLDVLTENTMRLKDGRTLRPRLKGEDEIAALDAAFHETAGALRREMKVLKASEEQVRSLIENLPVGIILLDERGAIEYSNATIEAEFKYANHQLTGKRLNKLFPAGQNEGREMTALRRDGTEFPVEFVKADLELAGEEKTLAIIQDATEKFEIKKARQSFVMMVRSQLKNPLSKIATFLTRLGGGVLGAVSPKGSDTTRVMQQNIERLITLLNDLFDLEKLESGKIDIEAAPIALNSILERSENAVAMFAQKHKVLLQVPRYELQIYADGNRIVQVLVNFISNAIKFSPEGAPVTVAVRQSPTQVEISVIDRGRGIPESHVASVFEAYKQVEAADATKKGGTGLGLAICKAIVEAHGGEIGVNSEFGKGSVFWIRLPRSAPGAPSRPEARAGTGQGPGPEAGTGSSSGPTRPGQ